MFRFLIVPVVAWTLFCGYCFGVGLSHLGGFPDMADTAGLTFGIAYTVFQFSMAIMSDGE